MEVRDGDCSAHNFSGQSLTFIKPEKATTNLLDERIDHTEALLSG